MRTRSTLPCVCDTKNSRLHSSRWRPKKRARDPEFTCPAGHTKSSSSFPMERWWKWPTLQNVPKMTAVSAQEMDSFRGRVRSQCCGGPTRGRQGAAAAGRPASVWTAWTPTPPWTSAQTSCPTSRRQRPPTSVLLDYG